MNRLMLIVLIAVLVLIGPAMFVFSRRRALDAALARIHPGESPAQVVKALGRPQRRLIEPKTLGGSAPATGAQHHAPPSAILEYRYSVWPLPGQWRVEFRNGKVVGTARR